MKQTLPDIAVCLHCGYSLRGLPENVCPECGRRFDSEDGATFLLPRESWTMGVKRRLRELAGPPTNLGVFVCIAAALSVTGPLWSLPAAEIYRDGEEENLLRIVAFPAMAVCIFYWFVRLACVKLYPTEALIPRRRYRRWRWWVPPLALAISWSACLTSWPLHLRFQLSLPFIQAEARRLKERSLQASWPGRIGLFSAECVVVHADGRVRVVVREPSPHKCQQIELSYEPNGRTGNPDTYLCSFGGRWYLRRWGPYRKWF